MKSLYCLLALAAACICGAAGAQQTGPVPAGGVINPIETASSRQPFEVGALFSGGNGLTDNRGSYHFLQAGVHAGRVLTNNVGPGLLRGNFEYAVELYPYWQAFTPRYQRVACNYLPGSTLLFTCSAPYNTGGIYTGFEVRPIILRWNLAHHGRLVPWGQIAGGLLYTTHKFPAYGNLSQSVAVNGPNSETSVFNFTPQAGVGLHYFTSARRSIDFSANGEHISSASLGDRNPGVNASVQFSVGYTWWK